MTALLHIKNLFHQPKQQEKKTSNMMDGCSSQATDDVPVKILLFIYHLNVNCSVPWWNYISACYPHPIQGANHSGSIFRPSSTLQRKAMQAHQWLKQAARYVPCCLHKNTSPSASIICLAPTKVLLRSLKTYRKRSKQRLLEIFFLHCQLDLSFNPIHHPPISLLFPSLFLPPLLPNPKEINQSTTSPSFLLVHTPLPSNMVTTTIL